MFNVFKRLLIFSIITILTVSPLLYADDEPVFNPNRFDKLFGETWYGVYVQGGKVGYAITSFEGVTEPIDGWMATQSMTMIVNALGVTDTMKIIDKRVYQIPGGELYSSDFSMSNKTGAITVKGIKQGEQYVVTISVAGQENKKIFTFPQELLDEFFLVELAAINNSLAVGDIFNINTFESLPPKTGQSPTEYTVESFEKMMINGVSSDVYKLKMFLPEEGITGSLILDQAGNNLSWDLGTGIVIKLESKKQAMKLDESFDVLDATLIKVSKPIDDPTKLGSAKFLISGVDDIEFIESDYQRVKKTANGYVLSINRPTVPDQTYSIPVNLEEVADYLKPEVFIQSDAKEIIDLAKQIVGSKTNSYRAALTINSWVYNNIEKVYTPDISNALQTLQNGQGDCGEHAVLAVALCRAAGIPARTVTGLIYWPPGNGFGYHAWMEVYVGEWIAMDPSWNESEANPTHIALAIGDVVDQSVILTKVMGRMQIEVLEVE